MIDREFLSALTEAPSIGTACGPVVSLLSERMAGFHKTFVQDGFCLFCLGEPERLRAVLVAHMDEIGGVTYGPLGDGWFATRFWGNSPDTYLNTPLQGFDYLADGGAFPVEAKALDEERLAIRGPGVRGYRTGWTFDERTTYTGDLFEGKALDPRATLYAVVEAVRELGREDVGAMCVMAEECAMDVARKAVTFLGRRAPELALVVNADVPWVENLGEGRLDLPALRIFEGRNFIDPAFGIALSDQLAARGVEFHLSSARSGSQTILFTPLAPTVSVALPSDDVHQPRVRMSLTGLERCQRLLTEIVRAAL